MLKEGHFTHIHAHTNTNTNTNAHTHTEASIADHMICGRLCEGIQVKVIKCVRVCVGECVC